MTGLNEKQREIADTADGIMVVDAGPGTGKTHTITERYVNLIKANVSPSEILMVTFTTNAAREMRDRIRAGLIEEGNRLKERGDPAGAALLGACDEIRTSTFDAYCLRTVLSSPDVVSDFFGFRETLSRGATLVENDTLNREYFASFYSEFARRYAHLYRDGGRDYPALMADRVGDLYYLLVRLMSFGIIPLDDDSWFKDGERRLLGDTGKAMEVLSGANGPRLAQLDEKGEGKKQWVPELPDGILREGAAPEGTLLSDDLLRSVAEEDRAKMVYFIRHVYYEYIRQSVRDNRLTFSLVKIFAFAVLYESEFVREQNAVDYLMVDEFQDTDEMQLEICLMLLKRPNLCVVGDWKQGIYGFRNASVDNILRFEKRVRDFTDSLGGRVAFGSEGLEFIKVSLEENYRSTERILTPAFEAMTAPGGSDDVVSIDEDDLTFLRPHRESEEERNSELYRRYTGCEYWFSDDKESEFEDIVDKITEYVYSGKYSIVEDDGTVRQPTFGDIGVLFRKVRDCTAMYEAACARGIPAFLQGDMEIMSSEPGKLALAWLRFVNDSTDRRGISAILVYEGFTLPQIRHMIDKDEDEGRSISERLPKYLVDERDFLRRKMRRPNDLLTSIFAFHRIGDGDGYADTAQAIIRIVSSSYDGSLITVPDIIRLFEEDISQSTRYDVDAILGTGAVTIQTMHKSKGLEYPIVIVGGVSDGRMPSRARDKSVLTYDPVFGVRCRKEFLRSAEGTDGIVDSWRAQVISNARRADYDEERRLLFVSMSRAKQYMFVASGPKTSSFYKYLAGDGVRGNRPERHEVPDLDRIDHVTEDPIIPPYERRRRNIAVHDIMEYKEGAEDAGKGKEYGNRVHEAAQQMALGLSYDGSLPETAEIAKVLETVRGAVLKCEYDCALPVGDVTVRGVIDLMADFGDRIEIHDWKTDVDRRNLDSYALQLSVYAHTAAQARNVPVRCFVDFVSQGASVEIDPVPMEEIAERVQDYLTRSADVDARGRERA